MITCDMHGWEGTEECPFCIAKDVLEETGTDHDGYVIGEWEYLDLCVQVDDVVDRMEADGMEDTVYYKMLKRIIDDSFYSNNLDY